MKHLEAKAGNARRQQLRLEIVTAAMRCEWAKDEAKRCRTTPALTKFIDESNEECRILTAELRSLDGPAKRKATHTKTKAANVNG